MEEDVSRELPYAPPRLIELTIFSWITVIGDLVEKSLWLRRTDRFGDWCLGMFVEKGGMSKNMELITTSGIT